MSRVLLLVVRSSHKKKMVTGRMRQAAPRQIALSLARALSLAAPRQIALSRALSCSLAAPRLMGLLRVRAEHLLPIALVMMP